MQQSPAKDVNALTLDEIVEYMKGQFDPTRYVVRERFKYWSSMNRKPGESIQELAARIRHDAVTCNFPAIRDPLDEAMRTRFMCSVSNEAVLKALFKYKEEELTFAKAIAVAMETEEAAKVAKETVYGTKASPVYKVDYRRRSLSPDSGENPTHYACGKERDFPIGTCPRCGKSDHKSPDCPFREATCRYCRKRGRLEVVCLKKRGSTQPVRAISKYQIRTVKATESVPQLQQSVLIQGKQFMFEVDIGAGDNFCSEDVWCDLGKPPLSPATGRYEVANGQLLPTLGIFSTVVTLQGEDSSDGKAVEFTVTKVPRLNLLGRDAIVRLQVNISALMGLPSVNRPVGASAI